MILNSSLKELANQIAKQVQIKLEIPVDRFLDVLGHVEGVLGLYNFGILVMWEAVSWTDKVTHRFAQESSVDFIVKTGIKSHEYLKRPLYIAAHRDYHEEVLQLNEAQIALDRLDRGEREAVGLPKYAHQMKKFSLYFNYNKRGQSDERISSEQV